MLRSDFTSTNIPKAADIRNELLRLRTSLKNKVAVRPAGVHYVLSTLEAIRVDLGAVALTPPEAPVEKLLFVALPEHQAVLRELRIIVGDTSVAGNVAAIASDVRVSVRDQIGDLLLDFGWV